MGVGPYSPWLVRNVDGFCGWNIPVQRQPSRKEPAASGRDLTDRSARIVSQNCKPSIKIGLMAVRTASGLLELVVAQHATTPTRCDMRPTVLKVMSSTLVTHAARRG